MRVASCRAIQPLLDELGRRHPDVGIGVRPRGPLAFRVAERMSLISDALFLEATTADNTKKRVGTTGALADRDDEAHDEIDTDGDDAEIEPPSVPPEEQARAIAQWIYAGPGGRAGGRARQISRPGMVASAQRVLGPRVDPRDCDAVPHADRAQMARTPDPGSPTPEHGDVTTSPAAVMRLTAG